MLHLIFIYTSDPKKVRLVVLPNGDKPKVKIDYPVNPTAGEDPNVLGGRITISGSTEIARNSVKEVYIQIDTNYNGNFASDWASKLERNASGENFSVETDSAVSAVKGIKVTSSSKTNWRLNINENKTMEGTIAVKAIAVSESRKWTESEVVVFKIDKKVPQFSDLKLVQYQSGNIVKTLKYEDDVWISGSGWKLECVIEDDNGVNENSIITDNISLYPVTGKNQLDGNLKYKVEVPLTTNGFGKNEFTLEAEDTSEQKYQSSQSFVINYDNTAPEFDVKELSKDSGNKTKIENYSSGVYTIEGTFNEDSAGGYNQSGFERIAMYFTRTVGSTTYVIDPMLKKGTGTDNRYSGLTKADGMYWREAEVSTIKDDKITLKSSVPNNVRKGGLVKVSGAIYRINGISGQQIVVAGTPDTGATKVYFAIAQVIDNTIQENGVTTYYGDSNSINFDDDDEMVEGVSKVGTTYNWSVSINTANIFDGDVDIHFVAFDKAGNVTPLDCYGRVSNNAPRIAGVSFGTDDNGNNEVAGNEYIKNYANSYVFGAEGCELGVTTNGKLDTTPITNLKLPIENFDSAFPLMTVKGETSLNVKVVGGNTKLQWQWQIGSGNNWSEPITFANSSSFNDTIREQSVTITTYDFVSYFKNNKIEEDFNNTTLNIKIVDGTENGGQEAKIAIKVKTALLDTTLPLVKIDDFYWNSESENSLYDNSRANGHIELPKDLPTDDIFKESTGIYDTDPKVSGKITIEGTASDNVLLKALYVTIKDSENTNNFKGGSEFKIAERDENGNWTVSDKMSDDGWACEIFDEQFTIDGNTIKWKFHWDTEKLSTVAATDVNVQVRAEDRGTASISGNKVVYAPKSCIQTRRMDVVPYITDVKRNTMYSTVRAGSGAYPLLRGEEDNVIKGFNISGSNPTLSIATDKNGSNPAAMSDVKFSNGEILFTVPGTAKDGYLHLTVNGIPALNNMNKRDASYNSEASAESKYWTDDRYVRIWQDTDRFGNDQTGKEEDNMDDVILAKNIVYPAMSMSDDGKLYASFTNYGMHAVYYTTVNGDSTKIFNANDAPEETTILVTGSGSNAKVNVAFLANNQNGGDYDNWTPYRSDAGGLYLHDPNIDGGSYTRMELLYHDKLFQQFKNFRLARGSNEIIHTAYYDVDTMSIHYSNINSADTRKSPTSNYMYLKDRSFEATWVNIDGGYDEHDYTKYDGVQYDRDGTKTIRTDGETNVCLSVKDCNPNYENSLSRSSATGEYVGIDVTSKEYPVIAYFDSANRIIRLARANAENPKSNNFDSSNGANNWTIQRVITDTSDANYTTANGNYINLQIDSLGYVHIVFVNGRGELVYVKSTNTYDDENTAYKFGKSVVIAENSPMNVSMTVKGTTPYIGYLTSLGSFDGLNTAFWDDNLKIWETMSAPLVHTVANNRACVEAHPTPASSAWESAHAYYSVGYYRVAYYIGNGGGH